MKFLSLCFIQLKRIIKTPMLFFSIVLVPVLSISFSMFVNQSSDSEETASFRILNEDAGTLGASFLSQAEQQLITEKSLEETLEEVDNGDIAAVYVIPADFTETIENNQKPELERYTQDSQIGDTLFEQSFDREVTRYLTNQYLVNEGILTAEQTENAPSPEEVQINYPSERLEASFAALVFLLLFYIFFNANFITSDMITFRDSRILQRMIEAPVSNKQVLGSFLTAYVVVLFLMNTLLLFAGKWIIGFEMVQFGQVLLLILLACLISLSFAFMIFRLVRNATFAMLINMGYSIGGLLLTFLLQSGSDNLLLTGLAALSPFYWLMNVLDTNQLFPQALILLLMAAVFFTAGSYRLKDFATKS